MLSSARSHLRRFLNVALLLVLGAGLGYGAVDFIDATPALAVCDDEACSDGECLPANGHFCWSIKPPIQDECDGTSHCEE